MNIILFKIYLILYYSCHISCLVVNVKNQTKTILLDIKVPSLYGICQTDSKWYILDRKSPKILKPCYTNGGIIKEIIDANITDDTITVELQLLDSTLITQHIDFTKEVQIVQVLLLGEEERGQKPYQILCFVNHIHANEFISPDAMSKLRQKNPGSIRVAEDNKGVFNVTIDMKIKLKDSVHISRHVGSLCSEAPDTTFTSKDDIDKWASVPGMYLGNLLQTVEHINYKTSKSNLKLCRDTGKVWSHCLCTMEVSIPWYPCALKFCKDHIGKKSTVIESYRCGIQTCAKTMNFMYSVKHKQLCLSIE